MARWTPTVLQLQLHVWTDHEGPACCCAGLCLLTDCIRVSATRCQRTTRQCSMDCSGARTTHLCGGVQAQLEPMEPLLEEEETALPDRVTSASFTSRTGAGDSAPMADGTAGLRRSSAGSAVSAVLPVAALPPPSIVSMDAASGALASTGLASVGHHDTAGVAASVGGAVSDAGVQRDRCMHLCFRP